MQMDTIKMARNAIVAKDKDQAQGRVVSSGVQRLLTTREIMRALGFTSRTTIDSMVREGLLPPPVRIGPRRVAWPERDIEELQKKLRAVIAGGSAGRHLNTCLTNQTFQNLPTRPMATNEPRQQPETAVLQSFLLLSTRILGIRKVHQSTDPFNREIWGRQRVWAHKKPTVSVSTDRRFFHLRIVRQQLNDVQIQCCGK
jgi:predicted DNA-binding transcriptional regulator AlpA